MLSRTTTNISLRGGLAATLAVLVMTLPMSRLEAATGHPVQATTVEALLTDAKAGDLASLEAGLPAITDPALKALALARLAAARLDTITASRQLERYWANNAGDAALDGAAWSITADIAFADGDYARAATATREWAALLDDADPRGEADDVAQFHGIARMLASAPRQAVVKRDPRAAETRRDKAGLLRTSVAINDGEQDAVLDTGANLSVMSASAARRLGLRILDGEGSVGSSSREQVATRLGIAERFEIAGITLSNVVFLVLDDAHLEMPLPGGYRIDAIIGFPVLRAIGRMRFGADGSFTPQAALSGTATVLDNLRIVGSDLFVEVAVNGTPVAMHLDTGAPASSLSTRFARHHPEVLQGLEHREQRSAGAGGTTTQDAAVWKGVRVDIGGHATTLPELAIAVSDSADIDTRTFGRLGLDVIGAFDAYTIDFDTMSLEVERVAHTGPAANSLSRPAWNNGNLRRSDIAAAFPIAPSARPQGETTMRYLLLCCINEDQWGSIAERERAGIMEEYGAWMRHLDESGQHVASGQLQPTVTAATVRAKGGKPTITDGTFAETKEQIGSYHLIDCANLEDLLAVCAETC